MDCSDAAHAVDFRAMTLQQPKTSRRPAHAPRIWLAAILLLALLAAPGPAPAKEPGRRLAVVLGVSSFADWSIPNLETARHDALAMAAWLRDPTGGGFAPADVSVLLDGQATRQNIMAAMDRLAAEARPQDLVFIYMSTHGLFTADQVLGIVCHDSQATGQITEQGPVIQSGTVLTKALLHEFLGRLKARRRAVVVDVCYGQAALGRPPAPQASPGAKGCDPGEHLPPASSDPGAATLILVSSARSQRSWESSELGASIFTHYLLQGLRLHHGDLRSAFFHARTRTILHARREKGHRQEPYLVAVPGHANLLLGQQRPGEAQP